MARGTQLLKLVEMLREEVNRATSVAVGNDDLPSLKNKLSRTQEVLYDEYDWPFLRQVFPAKALQAGERYYDFPTGLNVDRIDDNDATVGPGVVIWYSNFPRPIQRGIGFKEYAIYNSDAGVRQEPALAWDVRWTGSKEQFEVWPVPVSNTMTIQFKGIRKLRPLIQDSDVCDLDDQLIVLFAAAEILARQGSQSAPGVAALAKARLVRVKGRSKSGSQTYRLGMGEGEKDARFPIVVHARST
ncbi:hypothetical protein ABIE87_006452 [Bradyrhizobium diazoefficiens]|uniref:phage adaptor protein n=1 Tax=Bradyrhizobium diazoefficiens TaxID=1355477 RepID=UPI0035146B66